MEPSECKAELEKLFPDRYTSFEVHYNRHVNMDGTRAWTKEYLIFGMPSKPSLDAVIGRGDTLQEAFDKMKATL